MNTMIILALLGILSLTLYVIPRIRRCHPPLRRQNLKVLKKVAAGAFVSLHLLTSVATAADTKDTAKFIAGEFNIEGGYVLATEDFGEFEGATYFGGNYLLTPNIGLHGGITAADEFHGTFVQAVEFGVFGRLRWKSVAFEFGTGAEFALGPDEWAVYAEAGPRWRVAKHLDLFARVRGVRPIAGAEHEHVQVIVGVGVPFTF